MTIFTTTTTDSRIGPPLDIAERNANEYAAVRASRNGYAACSPSDGYLFTCPTCGAAPKAACILTRGEYKGWPMGTYGGGAGCAMVPQGLHEMHPRRRALALMDETVWAAASSSQKELE